MKIEILDDVEPGAGTIKLIGIGSPAGKAFNWLIDRETDVLKFVVTKRDTRAWQSMRSTSDKNKSLF
jgi:hypothetical protein